MLGFSSSSHIVMHNDTRQFDTQKPLEAAESFGRSTRAFLGGDFEDDYNSSFFEGLFNRN